MEPGQSLLDHVLVPIADETDARSTAAALEPYEPKAVTVVYVVERASGAIDPVPASYLEESGEEAFEVVRSVFPDAEYELAHGDDLVERIYDVASAVGATAIAYRSRGGSRFIRLLSGDHSIRLVSNPPIPVISLPEATE